MKKLLIITLLLGIFCINSANAQTVSSEINDEAYRIAKDQNLPMTEQQIRDFLKDLKKAQKTLAEAQQVNPEKKTRLETVPLDPGAKVPTINLTQGYVTTLSFLDVSGNRWPIIDIVSGGDFEITPPEKGGHIVRISPNIRYGYGNMSVRLQGLEFPITLNVEVADDKVDYRFDAKIPMQGPKGNLNILTKTNIMAAGNAELSMILEGVMPEGIDKLEIDSGNVRNTAIYQKGDMFFIRTMATLLSPAWEASATTSTGLKVYSLKPARVLLFSDDGEIKKLKLTPNKE